MSASSISLEKQPSIFWLLFPSQVPQPTRFWTSQSQAGTLSRFPITLSIIIGITNPAPFNITKSPCFNVLCSKVDVLPDQVLDATQVAALQSSVQSSLWSNVLRGSYVSRIAQCGQLSGGSQISNFQSLILIALDIRKKDLACTATMMGVRPSTSLVSRQSLLQLGWANNLPSNHCLVGLLSFSGRALALLKKMWFLCSSIKD